MRYFEKISKKKKEDSSLNRTLATAGAVVGGTGATYLSSKPRIFVSTPVHPTQEVLPALKEYKPRQLGMGKPLLGFRKNDILITNYSQLIDRGFSRAGTSVYLATDQGNASKDISSFIKKNPKDALNWGTDYPEKATHILGSKGIKPSTDKQVVVEMDNIFSQKTNYPSYKEIIKRKMADTSGKKKIGLTFGNYSHSGTFLGTSEKPYNRVFDLAYVRPPKFDSSRVDTVIKALDTKYGPGKYELEIFTGGESRVHNFYKNTYGKNPNIKLTSRVPFSEFTKNIYQKDLLFTNPGLNIAGLVKSDYKIPTILVGKDVERAHSANFKENIKYMFKQQKNVGYLDPRTMTEEKILKTIKKVENAPKLGKAMLPNTEALKKIVSESLTAGKKNAISRTRSVGAGLLGAGILYNLIGDKIK